MLGVKHALVTLVTYTRLGATEYRLQELCTCFEGTQMRVRSSGLRPWDSSFLQTLSSFESGVIRGAIYTRSQGRGLRYGIACLGLVAAIAIRQVLDPTLTDRLLSHGTDHHWLRTSGN